MTDLISRRTPERPPKSYDRSALATRGRMIFVEGCWFLIAVAIAVTVTAYTAQTSGRGNMMFFDGDSMIVPLFARSLVSGQQSDWGMSAVLFVPELALYLLASILPVGVAQLQVIAAILNLICLYLVLRLAARWVMAAPQRRVAASFAAYSAYCLLILLEGAGDRNSLELASLLEMTTYYSGAVLTAIITVAATQRMMDTTTRGIAPTITLIAVSAISSFSNPIFIAWVTFPLVVVTLISVRSDTWRRGVWITTWLLVSAALGYLGRLPLDRWIIASGDNYFRAGHVSQSFAYYADLFSARVASTPGVVSCGLVVSLFIAALVLSLSSWRQGSPAGVIVSTYAWLAPLATAAGLILLGTEAARYLQVWIFAPIMAILIAVDRLPAKRATMQWPGRLNLLWIFLLCVLASGVAVGVAPTAVRSAQAADESLSCAVNWIDRSDRIGAGQFWSVRAVKAHLAQPSELIQVDYQMNGYGWLVDRNDYFAHSVSFLVTDPQTYPFALAEPYASAPHDQVDCGEYLILDYGELEIPVGPVWPK